MVLRRTRARTTLMASSGSDNERNRFSARASRYARVGVNVGGVAARIAGAQLLGRATGRADRAAG